jgi:hypothetical protein
LTALTVGASGEAGEIARGAKAAWRRAILNEIGASSRLRRFRILAGDGLDDDEERDARRRRAGASASAARKTSSSSLQSNVLIRPVQDSRLRAWYRLVGSTL